MRTADNPAQETTVVNDCSGENFEWQTPVEVNAQPRHSWRSRVAVEADGPDNPTKWEQVLELLSILDGC